MPGVPFLCVCKSKLLLRVSLNRMWVAWKTQGNPSSKGFNCGKSWSDSRAARMTLSTRIPPRWLYYREKGAMINHTNQNLAVRSVADRATCPSRSALPHFLDPRQHCASQSSSWGASRQAFAHELWAEVQLLPRLLLTKSLDLEFALIPFPWLYWPRSVQPWWSYVEDSTTTGSRSLENTCEGRSHLST